MGQQRPRGCSKMRGTQPRERKHRGKGSFELSCVLEDRQKKWRLGLRRAHCREGWHASGERGSGQWGRCFCLFPFLSLFFAPEHCAQVMWSKDERLLQAWGAFIECLLRAGPCSVTPTRYSSSCCRRRN